MTSGHLVIAGKHMYCMEKTKMCESENHETLSNNLRENRRRIILQNKQTKQKKLPSGSVTIRLSTFLMVEANRWVTKKIDISKSIKSVHGFLIRTVSSGQHFRRVHSIVKDSFLFENVRSFSLSYR